MLWVWSHCFFNSPPTNFSSLALLKIVIITDSSVLGLLKITMLESERPSLYTKFMLVSSPFHCLHSDETRSMNHLGTFHYIYHRNILAKRPSQTFLMPPLKPKPCKLNDEDNQEFVFLQQPAGQGCQQ